MNKNEMINYVKEHSSGKVKIAFTDMDGILRGKYISTEKFLAVYENETSFCDVIFGWDAADVAYDNARFTGWHTGYPDCPAQIDTSTFRKIPWENDVPFFLGDFYDSDGNPSAICPRQLVKKVLADAETLGYTPSFSQEFEWYNFAETPQSVNDKQFKNLTPLLHLRLTSKNQRRTVASVATVAAPIRNAILPAGCRVFDLTTAACLRHLCRQPRNKFDFFSPSCLANGSNGETALDSARCRWTLAQLSERAHECG